MILIGNIVPNDEKENEEPRREKTYSY